MIILFTKTSDKYLKSLDALTHKRISIAISKIPAGDIKPLQGKDSIYRLRVGKYRVLFKYVQHQGKNAIAILNIGSRGDIYK